MIYSLNMFKWKTLPADRENLSKKLVCYVLHGLCILLENIIYFTLYHLCNFVLNIGGLGWEGGGV